MKYYSIKDILELDLPDLPKTQRGISKYVEKQNWNYIEVPSRGRSGKRKEYQIPDYLIGSVKHAEIAALEPEKNAEIVPTSNAVAVSAQTAAPRPSQLAGWQRDCATARLWVCQQVLKLSQDMSKTKAVKAFIAQIKDENAPDALLDTVAKANAKNGKLGKVSVSERTLWTWLKEHDTAVKAAADGKALSVVSLLAPKTRDTNMPAWAPLFLKLWGQPSKPDLTDVVKELAVRVPEGMTAPNYHQARYFLLAHMGNVAKEEGRLGARKIKELKPFVRRDTTGLEPTDVYTADGHTFDAEVAHPSTGKPFRPEITTIMDVATRMVVGFSIDLAESRWAVLDAIRSAAIVYGIPAIFYVDNGSGYKNDLMQAEGRGLMSRLGTQMKHSIAYNSQARGGIERIHQTLWVKLAKKLPTYMGADMDAEASQKAFKKTRKDIVKFQKSKLLLGWDEFMQACVGVVNEYNQTSHSSLPRRHDKTLGKRRNLSPNEYWQEYVAQGFEAVLITEAEQEDLFRPYVERKCQRCEIQLFGNTYFSAALEQYHGDTVYVGYDIHDADRVWVRDVEGRLLAVAKFGGNKTAFYSQSVMEKARAERTKGRLRRNAAKEADILEEMNPQQRLEHVVNQRIPEVKVTQAQSLMTEKLLAAEEQAAKEAALAEETERKRMAAQARLAETVAVQANTQTYVTKPLYDFDAVANDVPPHNALDIDNTQVDEQPEPNQYARWLVIDSALKATTTDDALEEITPEDRDFWELFPMSKKFALLKREHEQAQQKTHPEKGASNGQ